MKRKPLVLIKPRRPPEPRLAEADYIRWSNGVMALWAGLARDFADRAGRHELVTRDQIEQAWVGLLASARLPAVLDRVSRTIDRSNASYFRSLLGTGPRPDAAHGREAWISENRSLWLKLGRELADRILAVLGQPRLDADRPSIDLIRGTTPEQRAQLWGILKTGSAQGVRHEDLIGQVQDVTGFGESRSRLIARDQTVKHNAAVASAQARALGVTRYRWRTVRDEAVRPMHKALNGQIFTYGQPPITNKNGDRNEPGQDFQCRCSAEPIIELFAGLDDESLPEPIERAPQPAPREPRIPAPAKRTIAKLEQGIPEQELSFLRSGYRAELTEVYRDVPTDLVNAIATGQQAPPGSRNVLPPITITSYPDGMIALVDGRHRLEAAQKAGATQIRARIVQYDQDLNIISETERIIPVPTPDKPKLTLLAGGPRP